VRAVLRILAALSVGLLASPGPGRAQALSLGLIGGDAAGTESVLAAEMAELFAGAPALRVVPKSGDAGRSNLARLLTEPGTDIAFVAADALTDAGDPGGSLLSRVTLVARLGRKVNFGPAGGSAALAAERLFKALNIAVAPQALELRASLAQLQRGAIDAVVVVGGKPVPIISQIPSGLGIHLLPVPFAAAVEDAYLPARFDHDDYPNLIETETSVPSLATGMVLLAARGKNDAGADDRVATFIEALFSRFGELDRPGHHAKWREVNLAATLPGWTRAPVAEAWLARRPSSVGNAIEASAAGPAPLPMSEDQKEALFKGFVEWQRAKRH